MSIELNIEFTYTPGLNLEASITGFVTVVSNFFSFVGLYVCDPDVTGFPTKYMGFLWFVFIFLGSLLLWSLTPEYKRQNFLHSGLGDPERKPMTKVVVEEVNPAKERAPDNIL